MSWYDYDAWDPPKPEAWIGDTRHDHPHELDPHLDLGCGTVPKGRIGVDRFPAPGVAAVMDLDRLLCFGHVTSPNTDTRSWEDPTVDREGRSPSWGLPFADSSIKSVISHHCFEHIGDGFIPLIDEIYRVLEPGGWLRAITPLFPSRSAVEDPDHRRYFMEGTWDAFGGHLGDENNPTGSWLDAFSVPYTKSRFTITDKQFTPAVPIEDQWGPADVREIRVSLVANK